MKLITEGININKTKNKTFILKISKIVMIYRIYFIRMSKAKY